VNAALEPYIRAILVLTTSGETARQVARFRPCVPVIAVTRDAQTARQLQLHRGLIPLAYTRPPSATVLRLSASLLSSAPAGSPYAGAGRLSPDPLDAAAVEWQADVDARFAHGIAEGRRRGVLAPGDCVVLIQGPRGGAGHTNTLRIVSV